MPLFLILFISATLSFAREEIGCHDYNEQDDSQVRSIAESLANWRMFQGNADAGALAASNRERINRLSELYGGETVVQCSVGENSMNQIRSYEQKINEFIRNEWERTLSNHADLRQMSAELFATGFGYGHPNCEMQGGVRRITSDNPTYEIELEEEPNPKKKSIFSQNYRSGRTGIGAGGAILADLKMTRYYCTEGLAKIIKYSSATKTEFQRRIGQGQATIANLEQTQNELQSTLNNIEVPEDADCSFLAGKIQEDMTSLQAIRDAMVEEVNEWSRRSFSIDEIMISVRAQESVCGQHYPEDQLAQEI